MYIELTCMALLYYITTIKLHFTLNLKVIETRRKMKNAGINAGEVKLGDKKLLDFIDILMETKVCNFYKNA